MMCKNPYGGGAQSFFLYLQKKRLGHPWAPLLWEHYGFPFWEHYVWASILGTLPASILGPLRASILGALRATIMVMWISNYSHVYPFSKRINSLLYVACEPTGQSSFGCNWLSV